MASFASRKQPDVWCWFYCGGRGPSWFTFQFIEPAPPRTLTVASGNADGAYYRFATQLREQFELLDYSLIVIETDGSVDNLKQLHDGSAICRTG